MSPVPLCEVHHLHHVLKEYGISCPVISLFCPYSVLSHTVHLMFNVSSVLLADKMVVSVTDSFWLSLWHFILPLDKGASTPRLSTLSSFVSVSITRFLQGGVVGPMPHPNLEDKELSLAGPSPETCPAWLDQA